MRMRKDNDGQMSIDFLVGVTIFILAFIYLMMVIPSMFTPFQSNSDELTMIADRVGTSLMEKELSATNGAGEPMPGIVYLSNINTLNTNLDKPNDLDTEDYRKSLGLDYGAAHPYHLQVLFIEYRDDGLIITTPYSEIPEANKIKPGSQNVGQSRRFVYVRDPADTGISRFPGYKEIMVVRVW